MFASARSMPSWPDSSSTASLTKLDEPITTSRASGGECSINGSAPSAGGVGFALACAAAKLSNPPVIATPSTCAPFFAGSSGGGANPPSL
ncbi:hypothetical protein D3C83_105180 [compost metagenome]